jgi:hypothetical protein
MMSSARARIVANFAHLILTNVEAARVNDLRPYAVQFSSYLGRLGACFRAAYEMRKPQGQCLSYLCLIVPPKQQAF